MEFRKIQEIGKIKNVCENHVEFGKNRENHKNIDFDAKSGVNHEDLGWFTKENDKVFAKVLPMELLRFY